MIFSYFTNTRPAQLLPDFMRNKKVCDKVLRLRIHDVGNRHVGWAQRSLKRQGGKVIVDWAQGAAYKFMFPDEGDLATEIRYAPTGKTIAIPKQVNLERGTKIVDNAFQDTPYTSLDGMPNLTIAPMFKKRRPSQAPVGQEGYLGRLAGQAWGR